LTIIIIGIYRNTNTLVNCFQYIRHLHHTILQLLLQVTSFAIHIMPAIFHYLLRWEPQMKFGNDHSLHLTNFILYPLFIYLLWQAVYLFIQFNYIDEVTLFKSNLNVTTHNSFQMLYFLHSLT